MLSQIEAKLDEEEKEHGLLLAQIAEYLASLGHGDIDAMESYLVQVESATAEGDDNNDEIVANLAQTSALDENLAQVADFLAQLDEEDINTITTYLAQELSSSNTNDDDELMLTQTEVDDDDSDMLTKVATFMAQLSEEEIDSMENYLVQMEQATESGDQDTLAQLGTTLDENLATVADYLVQLDDNELAQLTSMINNSNI